MKRKGFIFMEVLLALLLLSALAAAVFPRADGGSHGIYGPAEAGSERSCFCCRFHDREDTEQS